MAKACTDPTCLEYALPNAARCRTHQAEKVAAKPRSRAISNGAARRLRYKLSKDPSAAYQCRGCRMEYYPHHLEVDHILPLFLGGVDLEPNLQVLCISCHRAKSVAEQRDRADL